MHRLYVISCFLPKNSFPYHIISTIPDRVKSFLQALLPLSTQSLHVKGGINQFSGENATKSNQMRIKERNISSRISPSCPQKCISLTAAKCRDQFCTFHQHLGTGQCFLKYRSSVNNAFFLSNTIQQLFSVLADMDTKVFLLLDLWINISY